MASVAVDTKWNNTRQQGQRRNLVFCQLPILWGPWCPLSMLYDILDWRPRPSPARTRTRKGQAIPRSSVNTVTLIASTPRGNVGLNPFSKMVCQCLSRFPLLQLYGLGFNSRFLLVPILPSFFSFLWVGRLDGEKLGRRGRGGYFARFSEEGEIFPGFTHETFWGTEKEQS